MQRHTQKKQIQLNVYLSIQMFNVGGRSTITEHCMTQVCSLMSCTGQQSKSNFLKTDTEILGAKRMKSCTYGCHTCIPHTRTPSVAEVLCSHFFIWRAAFSSEASSPCCRVPIFRSRIHGQLKWWTTFSRSRNSEENLVKKHVPIEKSIITSTNKTQDLFLKQERHHLRSET